MLSDEAGRAAARAREMARWGMTRWGRAIDSLDAVIETCRVIREHSRHSQKPGYVLSCPFCAMVWSAGSHR